MRQHEQLDLCVSANQTDNQLRGYGIVWKAYCNIMVNLLYPHACMSPFVRLQCEGESAINAIMLKFYRKYC